MNCYILDAGELESNPDMTGEYNVPRAISIFNKRIEPLLVVFKDEVRDGLLVDNPQDRGLFTNEQCELINGKPFEPEDQDSIEDLLTLSDDEMEFWKRVDMNPEYIYEKASEDWKEKI